jgi:hypothetical protein
VTGPEDHDGIVELVRRCIWLIDYYGGNDGSIEVVPCLKCATERAIDRLEWSTLHTSTPVGESEMTLQPQIDLLTALRRNLNRIEENGDDGLLTPAAIELKGLLLRRIAIIEAAMKCVAELAATAAGPADPIDDY